MKLNTMLLLLIIFQFFLLPSIVMAQISCNYDRDCTAGWYCGTDHTCKQSVITNQSIITKQSCPFECCPGLNTDDSTRYFDIPCANNYVCCNNHTCAKDATSCTCENCTPESKLGENVNTCSASCKDYTVIYGLIIFLIIAIILLVYFEKKYKIVKKNKP